MSTTTVFTSLSHIHCPNCGGLYAIAQSYIDEAAQLGRFKKCWTCPYCKAERGYGEGEIDRLNAELERRKSTEAALRSNCDYHAKEAEHFRRSRDSIKGALTKVKRRVAHGVCPCCKRTFKQLAAHMTAKHPDFVKE